MDFALWRRRLEAQQGGAVAWPPSSSPPARRTAIAELLRAYSASEGAEGEIAAALLDRARDADDRSALQLLLEDERRHAAILAEAAVRLEGGAGVAARGERSPSPRIRRLVALMRRSGLLDALVVFHLLEIAAVTVYRLLRATNRHDPLVRAALGVVLRDEAAHTAFHEERLVEAMREGGRLRRLRMRAVHAIAARLIVLNDASVAPRSVYPEATGLRFEDFNARVIRAYERAYSGRLAWLRW